MTENGNDQPIFVDPVENVVAVQGNVTKIIAASGAVSSVSNVSGQVYAAVVNGVTDSAPVPSETYNNEPYYPFNLDNLDISAAPGGTLPPPAVPSAPTNLKAILVGLTQISLVWTPSTGASSYIVDRSSGGTPWSAIATNVATASYSDSGLSYSTTYAYRVLAVSSAGQSAPSSVVSTQTGARPDVLAMQPLTVSATRRTLFSGPVAIFTDANATTIASRFIATINWGDGAVTSAGVIGSHGYFVVTGAHIYRAIGRFVVDVTVSMFVPDAASAHAAGVAIVVAPARRKARIVRRGAKPK
jgi:hypothetical protein